MTRRRLHQTLASITADAKAVAELADGIGFVVLAVGVFALGEIVANLGESKKGAVFVEELSEVPEGSVVIFSAHGVSQVRSGG